jgi:hypothetical protein
MALYRLALMEQSWGIENGAKKRSATHRSMSQKIADIRFLKISFEQLQVLLYMVT